MFPTFPRHRHRPRHTELSLSLPDAIALLQREVTADPTDWKKHVNLGMLLLLNGDLQAGFREMEWRRRPYDPPPQPRWTGQQLNAETVVLSGEQGAGDMLQFLRYARPIADRGGRVAVAVPKSLHQIAMAVDGVSDVVDDPAKLPDRFYFAWMMSMPLHLGVISNVPYIRADPAPWTDFLTTLPGLKIGLCWAGKPETAPGTVEFDSRRSMRLADMLPLLKVPGCSFVSLQLGTPADQLRRQPGLHDVSSRLTDWVATAALIAGLDLVITVDTGVAHLAGALGKPLWLLNRLDSDWRWMLHRPDSPWYPTMKIFRQTKFGDWQSVIANVARILTHNNVSAE